MVEGPILGHPNETFDVDDHLCTFCLVSTCCFCLFSSIESSVTACMNRHPFWYTVWPDRSSDRLGNDWTGPHYGANAEVGSDIAEGILFVPTPGLSLTHLFRPHEYASAEDSCLNAFPLWLR